MFSRKPLIVTGMHRSGTSLLANILRDAGVALGADSNPPPMNKRKGHPERRGHFEDKEFVDLHDAVIRRVDPTGDFVWAPRWPIELCEPEVEAAGALVLERGSAGLPWGWKDPRTVLFLEFWAGFLQDAVFLFVFRPPDQVVDSLRRRGDQSLVRLVPGTRVWPWGGGLRFFRYDHVFRSWMLYNERILEFVEKHPARSCLVEIDGLVNDADQIFDEVRTRLGIPLHPVEVSDIYDSRLMTRQPHPRVTRAFHKNPRASILYQQLRAAAAQTRSSG